MMALDKINKILNQVLIWIAGFLLTAMIFLTCANIFFRAVWKPINGTYELMGFLGATVTAFALGYTHLKRGHIAVDILVMRFSKRMLRILNGINYLICMIFFGLTAWQIAQYAATLRETGEVTETLRIIYYPFTYAVAFGCAILSLSFLADFLRPMFLKEETTA